MQLALLLGLSEASSPYTKYTHTSWFRTYLYVQLTRLLASTNSHQVTNKPTTQAPLPLRAYLTDTHLSDSSSTPLNTPPLGILLLTSPVLAQHRPKMNPGVYLLTEHSSTICLLYNSEQCTTPCPSRTYMYGQKDLTLEAFIHTFYARRKRCINTRCRKAVMKHQFALIMNDSKVSILAKHLNKSVLPSFFHDPVSFTSTIQSSFSYSQYLTSLYAHTPTSTKPHTQLHGTN